MNYDIFAPRKCDIRDGRLHKAILIAETEEEEKALYLAVQRLTHKQGHPTLKREHAEHVKDGR